MTDYSGPSRRKYYRLRYPRAHQPKVRIGGTWYPVTEISECGMRFSRGDERFDVGECLDLLLVFDDGENISIEGSEVVRNQDDETALFFPNAVSFDRMVKEQMFVIRNSLVDAEGLARTTPIRARSRQGAPRGGTLVRYPAVRTVQGETKKSPLKQKK